MADLVSFSIGFYILFAVLALVCEYVDSALGGGYGTILVPVLLSFNVDLALLVPAVLFTEIWTGFGSAALHHYVGNVDFHIRVKSKNKVLPKDIHTNGGTVSGITNENIKKRKERRIEISKDFKISGILGLSGVVGGIAAAFLAIAINATIIKTYVGVLVIIVGLLVFMKLKWKFSWWKISGIGLVAAFNKGLSGGGYGPLISSGQIIVDRDPRKAVASTSLSEGVVCVAALIIYFAANGTTLSPNFGWFVLALLIGALASVPLAVLTVKYLPIKKLQPLIGAVTILLGIFVLVKTYVVF
ncbi:MAG: sulfite exporter TauE/SafE family protein [Candidatus Heimdallarchaeota archaeon]|nr:sulfite exporter TauE/SafE family protein [Candidatus Heimdallarchaeota archaeon]MCG3257591.1 sulfite exporter TauE/SafE family protein [Candidatus Heimdallarchaeota archaeon]MCK4612643.1 sulfite exporter TauE/SafE family protein [Candidatus Heimdallarchaeota archaeon]